MKRLGPAGGRVTVLGVEKDGLLDLAALEAALTPKTTLVSVMLANNEIGVIQPVAAVGRILKKRGIVFHCDASQAAGKIPVDVRALGVDLLSFTAHKFYGPKGIGALYVRKSEPRVRLVPQMDGGGHETGFRSGTLNVPAIVGFGKACALASKAMRAEAARTSKLRDRLKKELLEGVEGCSVNGSLRSRLPNNLNVSFEGVRSADILARLRGVAVSVGSACLSSSPEPSYVLKEIGVADELRAASIRFGLGRFTTEKEILEAARQVLAAVRSLRSAR
jgi:cysteine desulfurase